MRRSAPEPDTEGAWPRQLAASMGQPPVASYRNLRIHADGKQALQSLWDVIENAERELVLCTFIIGRDAVGKALLARLIAKARSGTRIRLLLDGVGRIMGGRVGLHALKAAGVQVALFAPILHVPFKSPPNLRNHRKMVVADGVRLWCGGRNFAAEYFEGSPDRQPWRDLSFDLEGPLAAQARELFERDWAVSTGSPWIENAAAVQAAAGPCAQVIASGPDQSDDTVHTLLVTACFRARNRIAAVTPYFVARRRVVDGAIARRAAGRDCGFDPAQPFKSPSGRFARHRALRELAAAGGRVAGPYMLHAKAVVIDDDLALSDRPILTRAACSLIMNSWSRSMASRISGGLPASSKNTAERRIHTRRASRAVARLR